MRSPLKSLGLFGVFAAAGVFTAAGGSKAATPAVDFNRDIRPIFSDTCFKCHGPDHEKRKGDLRMDTRDGAFLDHKGKKPIVPGDPANSEAWRRINAAGTDDLMPPAESGLKLTPQQIQTVGEWIKQGAEYKNQWAFIPPVRPALPDVKKKSWPANPIDNFILARLEREKLHPSPEADKTTLIRRLTLDLTGLPPTPAEVRAFLADKSSSAYEKVVDRLLASPHYGERMAVDWLDAARFADTHGYHIDSGRDMTGWRKWVIDSFNQDKPFDQFTIEQLAGDLLPHATVEQKIASGFNRNHMINFEGGAIPEEYHFAYLVDRVNTTATVWLGLTVGCAQCHDHKYDPISQKNYYQLYAFFNNVPENGLDGSHGNAEPLLSLPSADQTAKQSKLKADLEAARAKRKQAEDAQAAAQTEWEKNVLAGPVDGPLANATNQTLVRLAADQRTTEQQDELKKYFRENHYPAWTEAREQVDAAHKSLEELNRNIPTTMVMAEMEQPRDTFVMLRGQYDKPGDRVTPEVPGSLPPLPAGAPANRLGLAEWLVSPTHPLTARVTVNRYWQIYFGTGIVKTAGDFGSQGEWPSHPELLDWLATEFITSGWDVKHIQKLIVMSATYRQSSFTTPELEGLDPENRLLARGPRFRLQAEFIRDQALAVSGLLNDEIGGKSVSPYQPPGLWEELASREDGKNWTAQTYTQSHGTDLYRRTMYTFWKRTSPPPTLTTFDAPDREVCTVSRARTDTPLQALVLLNDPTYLEASRKLAERMMTEAKSDKDRIALAFRLTEARAPKSVEMKVLLKLYAKQLARYQANTPFALELLKVGESPRNEKLDPAELAAWTMVASAILNLDETMTKG